MSNPIRGEYELGFFQPPRKWKLTMNEEAVCEAQLEVRRGKKLPFDNWLAGIESWSTEDWRLILWAGCRRYDKDLTEDALGEEMDGAMLLELKPIVFDFMSKRYPESAKKKLVEALTAIRAAHGMKTHGTQG